MDFPDFKGVGMGVGEAKRYSRAQDIQFAIGRITEVQQRLFEERDFENWKQLVDAASALYSHQYSFADELISEHKAGLKQG